MFLSLPLRSALANLAILRPSWAMAVALRLRERLPVPSSRVGWLLYTLAWLSVFVLLTFPSDLLLQRVMASLTRELAVGVRYGYGELTWRGACELRDLVIESSAPDFPALQLPRLMVNPSLLGLFFNQPLPLTFSADLYGGTVNGAVRPESGGMSTQFAVHRLALDLLPFPVPWGQGGVKGSLIGDGDLKGNSINLSSVQGTLTLNVIDGTVQVGALAGFPLPPLQGVQARLQATLATGRLEIADLTLSAEGVEAHLRGVVTLSTPVVRSSLNLQLTTKTLGSPPPAVAALLSLLPASQDATGERRASVTGSLAAPVLR